MALNATNTFGFLSTAQLQIDHWECRRAKKGLETMRRKESDSDRGVFCIKSQEQTENHHAGARVESQRSHCGVKLGTLEGDGALTL